MSANGTTNNSPPDKILDPITGINSQPQLLDLRSSNYSNYTNNLLGGLLDTRTKMSTSSQSVSIPIPHYDVFSAFDMGRTTYLRRLSIRLSIYRASTSSALSTNISNALIQEAYDMKKDPSEEGNVDIIWREMNSKELIKEIFNWFISIDIDDRKALKAGGVQLQWFVDDLLNNWPSSGRTLNPSKEKLWDDLFNQWRRLHPLHGEVTELSDPRMLRVFNDHWDKTHTEQTELTAVEHSRTAAAVLKALDFRGAKVYFIAKTLNTETVVDGEAKTPHSRVSKSLGEIVAESSATGEVGGFRSSGRVGNAKVNAKIEKVRISMRGLNGSAYCTTGIITAHSSGIITIADIGQIREIFNVDTFEFGAERDESYAAVSVSASPPCPNSRLPLRNINESTEASETRGSGEIGAVGDPDTDITTIKLRNRMSELVIGGSTSLISRASGNITGDSSEIGGHNGYVEVRVTTDSPIPNEPCKPRKTRGDDYVDDGNLNFTITVRDVQASSMLLIMATARFQISIGELVHTGFVKREYARGVDFNNSKSVRNLISWRDQFLERAFGPDYKSRPLRWLQLEKYWVLTYLEGRVCKTWNRLTNAYNRVFKGTKQRAGELYVQFPDRDDEFMAVERDAPLRPRSDIERVVTMWPEYRQIIRAADMESGTTAHDIAQNDVVGNGIAPGNISDDDTSMDEEEDPMPAMPIMSFVQAQAVLSPKANKAQGSKKRHQEEPIDTEAPLVKKRNLRTRRNEVNYYWDSE